MLETEGIDHVAMTVSDLQASVEWYGRVLGLTRLFDYWEIPIFLGVGKTGVALFPPPDAGPQPEARPSIGFRHLAFRVTRANFEAAKSVLDAEKISFEFQDHGISHSIYFPDPDGNELEITTYEISE